MSFGKEAVFPFPAVQYIPLKITEINHHTIQPSNVSTFNIQLIIGEDLDKWRPALWRDYQLTLDEKIPKGELPILSINAKANSAMYRGYFITMLGTPQNGYCQLFTLPGQYFYKQQLCFELFDENTSNRLARSSIYVP